MEERKTGEEIVKELKLKALKDKSLRLLNQLESLKNNSRMILDKIIDEGDGPARKLTGFDFWFPIAEMECGGYSEHVDLCSDLGLTYELNQEFKRDFAMFIREWYLYKTVEYEEMAKETLKQLSNSWN